MARCPTTKTHCVNASSRDQHCFRWRDLLQSRRQYWPTLTTRHASLAPLCAEALQRERRQMQAKHLWYNLDIRWVDLENKLQVLAPTGLTREEIWKHLFLTKQRQNPFMKGGTLEQTMRMLSVNGKLRNCTFWIIKKMVPVLPVLTWQWHFMASVLTILRRRMQLKDPRHDMLPDVRDTPLDYDNAAASSTDANPRWRNWDEDYAMQY